MRWHNDLDGRAVNIKKKRFGIEFCTALSGFLHVRVLIDCAVLLRSGDVALA